MEDLTVGLAGLELTSPHLPRDVVAVLWNRESGAPGAVLQSSAFLSQVPVCSQHLVGNLSLFPLTPLEGMGILWLN